MENRPASLIFVCYPRFSSLPGDGTMQAFQRSAIHLASHDASPSSASFSEIIALRGVRDLIYRE